MTRSRKIAIICLSCLFIILSILICLGKTETFDNFIYELCTKHMNETFTEINKIFTFLGSTKFIVFLCVVFTLFVGLFLKKKWGYLITSSIVIEVLFNNIIKIIIRRERPDVLKLVSETSFSYPSGHTMASVLTYGFLIYVISKSKIDKKYKIVISCILGIIPFLVAFSRIYLGAHFATDVIGGFIFSILLLLVFTYIIDKKEWM